MEKKFWINYNN